MDRTRNELTEKIWDALPYSYIPDRDYDLVIIMALIDEYAEQRYREGHAAGLEDNKAFPRMGW